eukprot:6140089-Pyramimonas_sp.AAC.1
MACLGGSRPPPFYYEIWSVRRFCGSGRVTSQFCQGPPSPEREVTPRQEATTRERLPKLGFAVRTSI